MAVGGIVLRSVSTPLLTSVDRLGGFSSRSGTKRIGAVFDLEATTLNTPSKEFDDQSFERPEVNEEDHVISF